MVYAPGSMIPVQASLRAGFAEIAPDIEVTFHPPDHSGHLARQILDGGAADVFISAGWRYVIELYEAGLIPRPEVIAGNRLALLVRPDLADKIRDVLDLARPGLRLVVPPAASDPLGQYTAELFAMAEMSEVIEEKRARGEISDQLRSLGDGMAAARIDAGVIYASMREMFDGMGTVIPLAAPYDLSDRIVFGAGAIERDGQRHSAAAQFVSLLIGSRGQALLTQAGFLPRDHALEIPASGRDAGSGERSEEGFSAP